MKSKLIKEFEELSIDGKIDFLAEYNIVEDSHNKDYFVNYVKTLEYEGDYWFLSNVIDFAGKLGVNDSNLNKKYLNILFKSSHYLLKLSILDFLMANRDFILHSSDNVFLKLEDLLKNKYERLIVKNQVLMVLMVYKKENRIKYQVQLLNNLKRTFDYRGHLRIYNTIINYDFFYFFTTDYINELINISKKMDLGKSVSSKITELISQTR